MRLLTRRPGFKAAANGLFSILKMSSWDHDVRQVTSTHLFTNIFQGLEGTWRMGVGVLGRRQSVIVDLCAIRLSQYIYQLSPVCQAWNQKLAVAEPEFGRGKRERFLVIGLEAIAQKGAREWGNPCPTLYIFREHPSPLLRKRTFDRQVDCMI